jgi:hypothetical protein
LAVTVVGSGSVAKAPDQATYHLGDVVQLTANPSAGWGFSAWSGDISGSVNPRTILINGTTTVTATFTWNAPAVTVDGAYHGARVSWTDVGALSYKIYYSSVNDPNGATQYATGVTNTTLNVRNLPSAVWDKTCYYWVAPVKLDGEAPKSSWGSGSDKVWVYKIEITSVTTEKAVAGYVKVHVEYRSRYLGSEGITVGVQIGEYLGPGTGGDIPNRQISIVSTRPIVLLFFMSAGTFNLESTSGEFVSGKSFKAWVMLWNQLPSEPGYWEPYAAKAELIPVTIP